MNIVGNKVVILSAASNPALQHIPLFDFGEVVVISSREECNNLSPDFNILLIIPPFDQNLIIEFWERKFLNIRWVHTLSAGVDFITKLIGDCLVNSEISLTNGRGAFSSSLAEYILASALYFNKQISTLQNNRQERKWDKFVMPTLKGKTMGFIGYGDIAKSAARIAKSFDMKIAVFRRDPSKFQGDTENLVDVISTDSDAIFSTADFVVCTLPATPETIKFCSHQFGLMKDSAVFISCGRLVIMLLLRNYLF